MRKLGDSKFQGKRRWLTMTAGLLVLVLAVIGCGDDDDAAADCESPDQVKVQLQWFAQAQFAGFYVAQDNGFYGDECLGVDILEGAVDIVPQQVLATGGAEFAVAWVPKALVSREAGADITNIAQVFERSGTLEVSLRESGITEPAHWAGKKVGNWGFGNEYELTAAIEQYNVSDVELVAQDFTMEALLNGDIDAAEAMIYNEYAQVLEATNPATGELYQPEDLNVIDFNDIGTAMLQDAIWAQTDWLEDSDNRDIATRFLAATFRGWEHCLDDFDNCVEVVLANGSTLGESHQQWQLNEILRLIFPATNGIGIMNETLWNQTVSISTTQVPELQGVEITNDAYRTDLAQAAIDRLVDAHGDDFDHDGSSYMHRDITLRAGGE